MGGGAATAPPPPAGGLDFSSLFGASGAAAGAGAGAPPAAAPPMANPFMFPFAPPTGAAAGQRPAAGGSQQQQQQAPGARFRQQLQNLQDMGFTDRSANIRALTTSHGNVNRAIEILLENPPEMGDGDTSEPAAVAEGAGTNDAAVGDVDEGAGESLGPKGSTEKKND